MPHDHPRLKLLKQQALEMGLSRDRVREFGSLTRRTTWESAITFHQAINRESDRWNEFNPVDNVIHTQELELHDTRVSSVLSLSQLITLFFLIAGFFVLVAPALQRFNLFPQIKITIQVGTK